MFATFYRATQCRAGLLLHRAVNSGSLVVRQRASWSTAEEPDPRLSEERAADETDVLVVGAGPAGLSAAIHLRNLAEKEGMELRVTVLEKAAEVGAHILSGAVIETRSLDELMPDWKEHDAPITTKAGTDEMKLLTETGSIPLPVPPFLHNDGNYIVSLGNVVRWLGAQAEERFGVEVYAGYAGSEVVYHEDGSVKGVATNDVGIAKNGKPKDVFERGMELHAPITLFAEGCRGSLTKNVINKFNLRGDGQQEQTYGIGIKEVWRVKPENHRQGHIMHTAGWPLDSSTYGGSFMYHFDDDLVSLGYVVALDYQNPYLSPFREFQRWKHHPTIAPVLEGGECISYGARAISEGGLQSLPGLTFNGGALVGDCAGFLNVPKIKGTHCAMKSGMLAAEACIEALKTRDPDAGLAPLNPSSYQSRFENSWLYKELHAVRNVRPGFQWGLLPGILNAGLEAYVFKGKTPWTLKHKHKDHEALVPKDQATKIEYPSPDGKISFDILTSVNRSNTWHEEDQPCHLTLKDVSIPVEHNLEKYDGPEARYCPAGVYEFVPDEKNEGKMRLQINQSNCVHCKTCDIKDPQQNINWVTPEGGSGPAYVNM